MNKTKKKKIVMFSIYFISGSFLNFIFDYLFRPDNIDLLRNISISFGLSFGIVFFSGIFNEKKEL